jgi:hypothetical protein
VVMLAAGVWQEDVVGTNTTAGMGVDDKNW